MPHLLTTDPSLESDILSQIPNQINPSLTNRINTSDEISYRDDRISSLTCTARIQPEQSYQWLNIIRESPAGEHASGILMTKSV